MKTTPVKIGKREFALALTADAVGRLQDTVPGFALDKIGELARDIRTLPDVLAALAWQGEYLEGRTLDVDRAWFGAHIRPAPASLARVQIAVLTALADGFRMETDDEEEGEQDVVLEELKKKGTPAGSPTVC